MKPEIKKRWVEFLRSNTNTDKQGRFHLHCNERFCVLGSLIDLAVQDGVCSWEYNARYNDHRVIEKDGCIHSWQYLSSSVTNWAGLQDYDPTVYFQGERHRLSFLNDKYHLSFETLATLIEEQL